MTLRELLNLEKPSLFSTVEKIINTYNIVFINDEDHLSKHIFKLKLESSGLEIIKIQGEYINLEFFVNNVVINYKSQEEYNKTITLDVESIEDKNKKGTIEIGSGYIRFYLPYLKDITYLKLVS